MHFIVQFDGQNLTYVGNKIHNVDLSLSPRIWYSLYHIGNLPIPKTDRINKKKRTLISTVDQNMMESTIGTYDFLSNKIASLKIKYFIYKFDSR